MYLFIFISILSIIYGYNMNTNTNMNTHTHSNVEVLDSIVISYGKTPLINSHINTNTTSNATSNANASPNVYIPHIKQYRLLYTGNSNDNNNDNDNIYLYNELIITKFNLKYILINNYKYYRYLKSIIISDVNSNSNSNSNNNGLISQILDINTIISTIDTNINNINPDPIPKPKPMLIPPVLISNMQNVNKYRICWKTRIMT